MSHRMTPLNTNDADLQARDSLELGSLASSPHSTPQDSGSSSPSGAPSSRRLSFDEEDPLHVPKSSSNSRHQHRSFSVSSAFDFAAPLFPLSSSAPGYTAIGDPSTTNLERGLSERGGTLERNKTLTYLNGLSLVIGLIIGSGIFSSPSEVNVNAGSPGASLIVWAIAGVLAWTGAASYVELGGAIPLNGGAQVYLAKIFGPMVGFLYTWCTVCILKPGSAAIIAIIFGEYIVRAVIGPDAADASTWINKGVAIAGLVLVTFLNSISTKIATRSADVFMFFKFIALVGVTVLGIVVATTGLSHNGQAITDWRTHGWFEGTSRDPSRWAVALYAGLWAFDGWDNVNFVAGEFINPSRDLPWVIHTSLPVVILSYLLANTAYFLVLPLRITSSSTTIAVAFGSQVLGSVGSLILALTVSGSCFGALNASTFTSSRLFYAAAKEGYLPRIIGTLGVAGGAGIRLPSQSSIPPNRQPFLKRALSAFCADDITRAIFFTPIPSLLLNFILTVVYVVIGTFQTLLTFYGVAGYFFYFLTVLGLLVLRVQEPYLERPYRCWITTPIIFCCVSLFLLSRSVFAQPLMSLGLLPFLLVGGIIYFLRIKKEGDKRHRSVENAGWKFWKRWARG